MTGDELQLYQRSIREEITLQEFLLLQLRKIADDLNKLRPLL